MIADCIILIRFFFFLLSVNTRGDNMMESESEAFGKLSQSSNRSSSSQEREIITSISSSPRKSSSSSSRSRSSRMGRETEEEAIIRRFHDAQRMARFRARKKKALEDKQQLQQQQGITKDLETEIRLQESAPETESKYTQLLAIIERIGRDVRLSYAGSRSSAERLKSGIVRARGLVRDCLIETRTNLRQ